MQAAIWLTVSQLATQLPKRGRYIVLDKPQWLAPHYWMDDSQADASTGLNRTQLIQYAHNASDVQIPELAHCKSRLPVQVAYFAPESGAEHRRIYIVDAGWGK